MRREGELACGMGRTEARGRDLRRGDRISGRGIPTTREAEDDAECGLGVGLSRQRDGGLSA